MTDLLGALAREPAAAVILAVMVVLGVALLIALTGVVDDEDGATG